MGGQFPGGCVLCRGPMVWTLYAGEVYVACARVCDSVLKGFGALPSDSDDDGHLESRRIEAMELLGGEGVGPPEGSADKMSDRRLPPGQIL